MPFRVALDETDSDDDEILNFNFAAEAAKRRRLATPVRDQISRARRVGATAKPRAAPVRRTRLYNIHSKRSVYIVQYCTTHRFVTPLPRGWACQMCHKAKYS